MKQVFTNLILSMLLLFAPIKAALLMVMALTVVDLVSGLIAAKKRGEKITSSGLKRTLVKVFVYEIVTMLGYLTEQYLTGDLLPLLKILTSYIGLVELKSVLENIESITGLDLLKVLIDRINKSNQ